MTASQPGGVDRGCRLSALALDDEQRAWRSQKHIRAGRALEDVPRSRLLAVRRTVNACSTVAAWPSIKARRVASAKGCGVSCWPFRIS